MNFGEKIKNTVQIGVAAAMMSGSPEAFAGQEKEHSPKYDKGIEEVFDAAENSKKEKEAIFIKNGEGKEKWFWGNGTNISADFLSNEKRLKKIVDMSPEEVEFIHSHPRQVEIDGIMADAEYLPPSLGDLRSAAMIEAGFEKYMNEHRGIDTNVKFAAIDTHQVWEYEVSLETAKVLNEHLFNVVIPTLEKMGDADPKFVESLAPQFIDHIFTVTEKVSLPLEFQDIDGIDELIRKNRALMAKYPGLEYLMEF